MFYNIHYHYLGKKYHHLVWKIVLDDISLDIPDSNTINTEVEASIVADATTLATTRNTNRNFAVIELP